MKEQIPLGRLIDANDKPERDAIHIAIAPVIAVTTLQPGQYVELVPGSIDRVQASVSKVSKCIGIIDPFLAADVMPNQRCWMLLLPNTITLLRHQWTHPAFHEMTVDESRRWVADFATTMRMTYSDLMEAAQRYQERGTYEYDNSESYKEQWDKFPEFWNHFENLTGIRVEDKSEVPFTCSC